MTLKIRWLAALVLLLAVGAFSARAEEEEAPPHHPTVELLGPPIAVETSGARFCWPSTMPGVWSMPSPCPVPMPYSLVPAVFSPVGECCPCPNCPLCTAPQATPPAQYVVDLKMVEGGDGDPDDVISHPRICVTEGQTGTVQTSAAGSKEQSSVQMQATLTKLDVGAVLSLRVERASSFTPSNNVFQSHTDTTQHQLPVQFGKATKLELTHDSNGACTSWVEVTVSKDETEGRMQKAASAGSYAKPVGEEQEADEPFGVDDCVEILQDLFDTAAEIASEMTGASSYDEPPVMPAQYLECPPAYYPQVNPTTAPVIAPTAQYLGRPPAYCPQTAATAVGVGTCPTCPAHSCGMSAACTQCVAQPSCEYMVPLQPGCGTSSACTQCVATEEAKQQAVHIGIDTLHHRVVMESNDGKKHVTTSADRITVHDGCLLLEGNVHMESSNADGSVDTLTGDKMSWKLPKGVDYHIGD